MTDLCRLLKVVGWTEMKTSARAKLKKTNKKKNTGVMLHMNGLKDSWAEFSSSSVLSSLSCTTRTYIELSEQPGTVPDQRHRPVQRPALPVRLHFSAAARRALPHVSLRGPVHAGKQPDGHREHLRAGGQAALQRGGVGQEHPFLPWPAAHGSGESEIIMAD